MLRNTVFCAALSIAVARAPEAVAQSASDKKQATKLLKEGAELLDRGDAAGALETFQKAHDIVPSPKIQFNIGLALEALARPARALKAFEAYLAGATSDAAERRKDAEAHVQALSRKVGRLVITAVQAGSGGSVSGASVFIDGDDRGRTPLPDAIAVDPGAHQIVVSEADRTWTKALSVAAGATVRVQAELGTTTTRPPPLANVPERPAQVAPPLPAPEEAGASATTLTADAGEPAEAGSPVYERPWFWVAVGAAVVATAAGAFLLTRSPDVQFVCEMGIDDCYRGQ